MKTEANVKQAVPFFAVSNIEKSIKYYVDGLGFKMTNKWIDMKANSDGAGLRLVTQPLCYRSLERKDTIPGPLNVKWAKVFQFTSSAKTPWQSTVRSNPAAFGWQSLLLATGCGSLPFPTRTAIKSISRATRMCLRKQSTQKMNTINFRNQGIDILVSKGRPRRSQFIRQLNTINFEITALILL